MADEIPQWAKERVCALLNRSREGSFLWGALPPRELETLMAFAAYIAAHEKPPVNPVHAAIETALARFYDPHSSKEWPGTVVIRSAIMDEFSRRGIELGKAGEA